MHAVGLDDGGDTRLGLKRPEFIQGVLSEDLIVELGLSFGVERETADLAFGFTVGGQVAVVLGSSGTELDDVVAWVEFIGEITEKIPKRGLDGWIVGSLDEDDRIGVGIENPRTETIEGNPPTTLLFGKYFLKLSRKWESLCGIYACTRATSQSSPNDTLV